MTAAASVMLVGGLTTVAATQASAVTQPEVCHDLGNNTARCWNNWGGANGAVNMYNPGVTNDAFQLQLINPCNSNPPDTVTPTCPFTVGSGMNNRYLGNFIFRVKDANSGFCVGTTGDGSGWEGACGNANAAGAANGVIMVQGNGAFYYVNRYWSNHDGTPEGAVDTGCLGCNLLLRQNAGNGLTAWDHGFV